jgi:hypothetical protein
MAVFTVAFLAGRYVYKGMVAARDGTGVPWRRAFNRKTALISLAAVVVVALVVLPAFYLYNTSTRQTGKWPTTDTPDVVRVEAFITDNAASPPQYLVPSVLNPVFGSTSKLFKHNRFPDFGNAIYLGWILILLGGVYVVLGGKRRRKTAPEEEAGEDDDAGEVQPATSSRRQLTATVVGLTTAMVVAFVLSLKPYWTIGSFRIPLPSRLMELVPWFRWYSRWGVVVFLCLVIIASLGLMRLIGRLRHRSLRFLVPLILVVLLFLELILVPPFRQYSFADTPAVFKAVKKTADTGGWVFYPLTESGPFVTSSLMFWQRVFAKPMLNGALDGSDGEALRRTVHSPYDKATPGILARFGLKHMVFFEEPVEGVQGQGQDASLLPAGYRQVARFKGKEQFGNARVYEVTAAPAEIVPLYLKNISIPYTEMGGKDIMLVDGAGVIRLVSFAGGDRLVNLRLPVRNPLSRRDVSLKAPDGKVLWRGVLAGGQETTAEIDGLRVPRAGTDIRLEVAGLSTPVNLDMTLNFGAIRTSIAIGDLEIIPTR